MAGKNPASWGWSAIVVDTETFDVSLSLVATHANQRQQLHSLEPAIPGSCVLILGTPVSIPWLTASERKNLFHC